MRLRITLCFLATLILPGFAEQKTEPFEFMLSLTRQDASLDWWYAIPTEFTPKINAIDQVAKGEYFNIIPFFKNYNTSTNGTAYITYDLKIIRPDGSIDEVLTHADGHSGKATPPNLIAARSVLHVSFDAEDPYGEYTIEATAYDHISNQTNHQSVKIKQTEFRFKQTTKKQREEIFITYATRPNPSLALACFLQTEQAFIDEEYEPVWSAILFYKTIFEQNEYLIPHLISAFHQIAPKHQKDLILVLTLMKRNDELPKRSAVLRNYEQIIEAGRIPNPYEPITSGKQLDMLWAEFFATGQIKPINQLLTSLNLCTYTGTLEKVKAGELDPENTTVYREAMLESVFQSALWSLRSNCMKSPLLFQYCVNILGSKKLETPAQSCLAMILKAIEDDRVKEDAKPKG
jgi:hypothetical protein